MYYLLLLSLFRSSYHPLACEVCSSEWHDKILTPLQRHQSAWQEETVVAGPSASATNIRNYMKPESKPKDCPALEYQKIKSTLQDQDKEKTPNQGQIYSLPRHMSNN